MNFKEISAYSLGLFGFQAGVLEQFEAHVKVLVPGDRRNDQCRQFDDHVVGRQPGNRVEQFAHLGSLLFRQRLSEGEQIAKLR